MQEHSRRSHPWPVCQADTSAVSDGLEDQGAEKAFMGSYAERKNRFRQFRKPSRTCERLAPLAPFESLLSSHVELVWETDLERLDFENNPATTIKAYRHQLVRRLPRVTELDGEEVTPLDRELAQQYAASEEVRAPSIVLAPRHRRFSPLFFPSAVARPSR